MSSTQIINDIAKLYQNLSEADTSTTTADSIKKKNELEKAKKEEEKKKNDSPAGVITAKDQEDIKKEQELQKVIDNKKNLQKIEKEKDSDKQKKETNNTTTTHGTDRSGRDFDDPEADSDVRGGSKERKPITQDIKGSDGKVIGQKKINPSSPEYQKAFETPKKVDTKELPAEVTKGKEKEIEKANTPEVKPEVKTEVKPDVKKEKDYLGKAEGLLGEKEWIEKTSKSPAARSGAFKPEERWAQQLKHRQWQKDNNRGAFKVDKKVTNSTDGSKVDTPKLKDNKEKATFKRRDQKLLDKGLKPPKYEKDSPTYTTKLGAFLNNKKKGDLKGSNTNNKILSPLEQEMESFDAYDSVMSYLIGTDQVESIEEANYVMLEMDGKTINDIKALAEGMPQYVRDSIGRQYGTGKYKGQPYTIEDKKNVINWYSRIKA